MRLWLGLILTTAAWAQPTLEVASVKPSKLATSYSDVVGGPGTKDPGRFTATNVALTSLVMRAYDLHGQDRLSKPAWMDTAKFDVAANVPPGTTEEQFREMLQNLLAERFRMQVHHETKVVPVYELAVAKAGPKLKPAAPGDGTDDFVPGRVRLDRDNFPILPPGRPNFVCRFSALGAHCTYRMYTMKLLVQRLSGPTMSGVGRRVVDKTGLTGQYDFMLYFRPSEGPDNDAPGIEDALQEQLGLKLVSSKASIDVLVIDHAETPTEN